MVDDTCQLLLNGWGCLLSTVWCIDDSLFGSQNLQCYDLGHRSTEKHGPRHQQLVVHGLIVNRQPHRLLHLDLLELMLFLSTMLYHHAWNMCAFLSNHLEQINQSKSTLGAFQSLNASQIISVSTLL